MTPRLWDPGVQNERTALAWARTALGLTVCALLAARLARTHEPRATLAVAFLGTATAGAVLYAASRRYRARAADLRAGRPIVAPAAVLGLTATVHALGLATLALLLL
ncbi:hypothetical protein TH66_20985 [Carbonactinospora thermoautotrophica]|uniref:DUF202 domain-containing protein n=1 Tax=Carbonactinospora thermoautotrophica TaxID=1469144 RepID=A0A132MJ39_9ACTN|nr:DUF202 domain-containing protein [Carbonactinospora thermoautotrophica]KWW97882.1 hypothetical protein TH66_20985 [Carbonactinospora thermoautotrophica]